MSKPTDKAEAIARELTARVGTKVSADDATVGITLILSEKMDATVAAIKKNNATHKKQQEKLIVAITKSLTVKSNKANLAVIKLLLIGLIVLTLVNIAIQF